MHDELFRRAHDLPGYADLYQRLSDLADRYPAVADGGNPGEMMLMSRALLEARTEAARLAQAELIVAEIYQKGRRDEAADQISQRRAARAGTGRLHVVPRTARTWLPVAISVFAAGAAALARSHGRAVLTTLSSSLPGHARRLASLGSVAALGGGLTFAAVNMHNTPEVTRVQAAPAVVMPATTPPVPFRVVAHHKHRHLSHPLPGIPVPQPLPKHTKHPETSATGTAMPVPPAISVQSTTLTAGPRGQAQLILTSGRAPVCWHATASLNVILHQDHGCLAPGEMVSVQVTVNGVGTIMVWPGGVAVQVTTMGAA
ncbi:MAG TPA: hypothetical protein VKU39_15325 [Streptosporangiaceae bacterium]|nr:hypothetical protein [Streptosporangiaceae bacterium]